jgi:CubicO group peptidase (beta-lactamase class C family)
MNIPSPSPSADVGSKRKDTRKDAYVRCPGILGFKGAVFLSLTSLFAFGLGTLVMYLLMSTFASEQSSAGVIPLSGRSIIKCEQGFPNRNELQTVLDKASDYWNASFTLSLVRGNESNQGTSSISLVSGTQVRSNRDVFAYGSVTKMYTSAAVLKLYEQGAIDLDDKITHYLDPWLLKVNGTTLTALYGNTIEIKSMTIANLLGMNSGIHDYDNSLTEAYQFAIPERTISPIDALYLGNRTFYCMPGDSKCAGYSSTNFEVLGLLLLQQANVDSIQEYDQLSFLKTSSRKIDRDFATELQSDGMVFPTSGTCKDHGVIDGFLVDGSSVADISCVGGFTCGNVLGPSLPVAKLTRRLLRSGKDAILSDATLRLMLDLQKLPLGTVPGAEYGLGLMRMQNPFLSGGGAGYTGHNIGHGGETYGFGSLSGYLPRWDMGYALAANIQIGEPLPGTSRWAFNQHVETTLCQVLELIATKCVLSRKDPITVLEKAYCF